MRATTHKTIRDLSRQRSQVIAVGVTIMLGVMLYVASAGAFLNLKASYGDIYDRLHFADFVATGGDAAAVASAAQAAGATEATTRTQFDPPFLIDGTELIGRVVGVPTGTQPTVDGLDVQTGTYLAASATDAVLLERHAAETFSLAVGDTLKVFVQGSWHTVTVQGIVSSPEYVWPARSAQEPLADSHSFAVIFVPETTAQAWAGTGPNQTLVLLPPDASAAVSSGVEQAMRTAGAIDVVAQAQQASNATLGLDLAGFKEMSAAFPFLFLTAAAIASYVLLARRILMERPVIGTLMAAGTRKGRLLWHYLSQGLAIGLIGAIVGVVLGALVTGPITTAYTSAIGVPETIVNQHPQHIVVGLLVGALVGLLGATAPALMAARTAPAEAMRSASPVNRPGWWSRLVARLRWLPVSTRMALRDVVRSRRRTGATMLGTVLALILILASVGMMTSMAHGMTTQFTLISREDATVTMDASVAGADQQLAALPDVTTVEPTVVGQVTAIFDGNSYTTTLQGFEPTTVMHGFRAPDGQWLTLPADGVFVGVSLAHTLHATVGDTITLATETGSTQVQLAGLVSEPMGTGIYSTNATAAGIVSKSGVATYLVKFVDGTDRTAMRNEVTQLPGVAAYTDARALAATIDQYLGLFWAFVGVMIILGAILSFTVIFVTMAVNIVERTNELATLRAAGVPLRRIAGALATENLLATVLGIPFGLVVGVISANAFLTSFNSDIFQFQLVLDWWVLPVASVGVLLAAAVSQWPAIRAVRKIDVARVVRERAT